VQNALYLSHQFSTMCFTELCGDAFLYLEEVQ